MKTFFTSESVTEGHPDKLCDRISDAILDAILEKDQNARVACETAVTTGLVLVMGEITTDSTIDIQSVVRSTIKEVGYSSDFGFDPDSCSVLIALDKQSPDIARGVDQAADINDSPELGAGDQGMMIGYACDETDELMPLPIYLAHKLTSKLAEVRKGGIIDYLGPDGKSQVTVEYEDGIPKRVDTIVISSQHKDDVSQSKLVNDIYAYVINSTIPSNLIDNKTKVFVNPTGRFVKGGPQADAGLTGRKIIVDTYGGYASHGGGAFSGKDPTKVDRSGAYAARYVAKNIVANGLAHKCEVELAYAIGIAEPVSININTYGSSELSNEELCKIVKENFDLRPSTIIDTFHLKRPIYKQTSSYGHFGRTDVILPWEMVEELKQ